MSYLIIELETQLLKTGKTSADLIRATGHTPANISKLRNGKLKLFALRRFSIFAMNLTVNREILFGG